MRTDSILSLSPHGFHRVCYTDWGARDNPHVVVCVHGLTRNARDFDFLAQALAADCRVVCPDVPGRGASDWLADPRDYTYPVYLSAMSALIARVTATSRNADGATRLDWVGTSMGGLMGMLLAAQPQSPIARLVLNDVGPFIPRSSLERIASYVGRDPRFKSMQELETYIRQVSAPFGPLSDEQWRHLTVHSAKTYPDGSVGMRYDPRLAIPFQEPQQDVDLWPVYDAVRCATLLLRGAQSDLLLADTALDMTRRGPRPALVEFDGVGHAPALMTADQIAAVRGFLLG
jgi:pimeloyl-ACP methyl ester carboxylesterase